MKPNRVPSDLIEAGSDAIRAWYAAHPDPNSYLDDRTQMRLVLAAALTLYNEQVEQPLRERAETAEAQLKALMQYTHEIGEVQAGLPRREAAVARAGYWESLQRATARSAGEMRERVEVAERELAELRERVGDLGEEWGCRYKGGDMLRGFESEADVRSGSAPGVIVYCRPVGEWREVPDA